MKAGITVAAPCPFHALAVAACTQAGTPAPGPAPVNADGTIQTIDPLQAK